MPYIESDDRIGIDKVIEHLALFTRNDPGRLNYAISKLIHNQLEINTVSYRELNKIIGVLECVKLELYRQIAVPYEDKKKKENGPVSNLDRGE